MTSREKLATLVLKVCREVPEAVNDEPWLLERVWYEQGWDDTKSLYDNLCRVSRPESITRARRKLHEEGLIKYSTEIETARYEAFKDTKEYYSPEAVRWIDD